jgi:drug/metabolite transporter (DMT)-like permease
MFKWKIACAILAIPFGTFMIVYGERDDSPGAQGLGLAAVIAGIVCLLRKR